MYDKSARKNSDTKNSGCTEAERRAQAPEVPEHEESFVKRSLTAFYEIVRADKRTTSPKKFVSSLFLGDALLFVTIVVTNPTSIASSAAAAGRVADAGASSVRLGRRGAVPWLDGAGAGAGVAGAVSGAFDRGERFGWGGTVSFEFLRSEFCRNSVRNHRSSDSTGRRCRGVPIGGSNPAGLVKKKKKNVRVLEKFIRNPEVCGILNTLSRIWQNSEKKSSKIQIPIMQNSMK